MKSIQELEKEKLQEEINLLRARIINEFPEDKTQSAWDQLSDFFRKWYSFILALFAVFGGFWGIFYPVKTYFNEQQKAVQYTINGDMITALEGLESEGPAAKENAIIILSYYDLNAIPILLNKYIESDYDDKNLQQDYIEAISLIYNRKQNEVMDRIIIKIRKNYNLLEKNTDLLRLYPLLHLHDLILNLDIVSPDEKKVIDFYKELVTRLKDNNTLMSMDDMLLYEQKLENFINKNK